MLQRQAHQDRLAHAGQLADAFRQQTPDQAMQEHPELAPAYAHMQAMDAKAEIDGKSPAVRAEIARKVQANIAASIERGSVPQREDRETRQRSVDQRATER